MDAFERLSTFPTAGLGAAETPLERLGALSAALGGATLYAKRDDAQPIAFGGNKVRQLDHYFGAALAEGADTVLITGAVQSNFCRLAAAFAAKLGLACHIQQEERVAKTDPAYRGSGNVLIERMLGAVLHSYPSGEDEAGADARLEAIAADLSRAGKRPYVIHLAPGHPPLGALGYMAAARECVDQLGRAGIRADQFILPSGSGATHGGFLFGLRALGVTTPVLGVCVRRDAAAQRPRLIKRCAEIAALLGVANPVADADVELDDRFLAPGYGLLNPATEAAILAAARREALILDPVYTGKAMAGALDAARALGPGRTAVFLHTGGSPAVFAYAEALAPMLAAG